MSDTEGSPVKRARVYDNLNVQSVAAALGVLPAFVKGIPKCGDIDKIEVAINDEGEVIFTDPETGKAPVFQLAGKVFSWAPDSTDGHIDVTITPDEATQASIKSLFFDKVAKLIADNYKKTQLKGKGRKPIITEHAAKKIHAMTKNSSREEIVKYVQDEVLTTTAGPYHPVKVDPETGVVTFKVKIKPFKPRDGEALTEEDVEKLPAAIREAGRSVVGKLAYKPLTVIGTEGDQCDYLDIPDVAGRRTSVGVCTVQLRRISPGQVPYTVATPLQYYICACEGGSSGVEHGTGSRGLFD